MVTKWPFVENETRPNADMSVCVYPGSEPPSRQSSVSVGATRSVNVLPSGANVTVPVPAVSLEASKDVSTPLAWATDGDVVGKAEGWYVGSAVRVGVIEGKDEGPTETVGTVDGDFVGIGDTVGDLVGITDGIEDFVGTSDGEAEGSVEAVGAKEGVSVGNIDGISDGRVVGPVDGLRLGNTVGCSVGTEEGCNDRVGSTDGTNEG